MPGINKAAEKSPLLTLETLLDQRQDLGEMQKSAASSAALIALNRFYVSVETYCQTRGLAHNGEGRWLSRHWSYKLLEQLARLIQDCKDAGGQIAPALLSYIDQELLPRLEEQKKSLS